MRILINIKITIIQLISLEFVIILISIDYVDVDSIALDRVACEE